MTHLDLDALADALAGDPHEHLAACAACQARLEELRGALPAVDALLARVPPAALPDDVAARVADALAHERAGTPSPGAEGDVLPLRRPTRSRLLPVLGAAAVALGVLAGGALLLGRDDPDATSTSAADRGYAVSQTGTDYDTARLRSALPGLLAGDAAAKGAEVGSGAASQQAPTPESATLPQQDTKALAVPADPLAELRTTDGLATCLDSLSDPEAPAQLPLALDYASFKGQPALIVVLPAPDPKRVDVFVVPPGCAQADGSVLFFTSLPRP